MLLYDYRAAPNPRRVRMFLAEKGVTIPTVQINLIKGQHRLADYMAKDPFVLVPLLELDNGKLLGESVSICRYIEELHPTPPLLGRDTEERAFIDMWSRRAEFELLPSIAGVFRHGTEIGKALEPDQIAAWARASKARALRAMQIFDNVLAGRRYVAGPDFSIADITLLCSIDFGANTGAVQMPDDLQHLKRWHGEVSARPSAAA